MLLMIIHGLDGSRCYSSIDLVELHILVYIRRLDGQVFEVSRAEGDLDRGHRIVYRIINVADLMFWVVLKGTVG